MTGKVVSYNEFLYCVVRLPFLNSVCSFQLKSEKKFIGCAWVLVPGLFEPVRSQPDHGHKPTHEHPNTQTNYGHRQTLDRVGQTKSWNLSKNYV